MLEGETSASVEGFDVDALGEAHDFGNMFKRFG